MKTKRIRNLNRLITILVTFILMLSFTTAGYAKTMEFETLEVTSSSQYVTVDGKQMHVVLYGQLSKAEDTVFFQDKEKTTLVMIPGLAVSSPAIYMKPLAEGLQSDFNIVIVEPFGYGLSSLATTERTVAHINEELNILLETMGIQKCVLVTHSIAGAYGLRFVLDYPDKAKGFVAIDNTVYEPSVLEEIKLESEYMLDELDKFNTLRNSFSTIQDFKNAILEDPEKYGATLPNIVGYTYSDEDTLEYIESYVISSNSNSRDEISNFLPNVEALKGEKFSDSLPVLMLVSSENAENLPGWWSGHLDQINSNSGNHTCYKLEGGHYLWYDNYDQIVESIRTWCLHL